ncbi:MAG: hypothetical protein KC635_11375 [Myxococcales bacterium]|nr:hypothetical protein [Myxococcales bacterium]
MSIRGRAGGASVARRVVAALAVGVVAAMYVGCEGDGGGVADATDRDEVGGVSVDAVDGVDARDSGGASDVLPDLMAPDTAPPRDTALPDTSDASAPVDALGERERCEATLERVRLRTGLRVAVYVELLWCTPGDADETDRGSGSDGVAVGSDLDLHVHTAEAVGRVANDGASHGWFDDRWDCYWQNQKPDWGAGGSADDPIFDGDDSDGGGPESVMLGGIDGETYTVGVHSEPVAH